ncbi:hypothetical protein RRF57_000447 [Xylaria bambusicola]|uniref:Uncharacterized protein n=1 Tax=Xylaria bambusicola TaxID=326684 RepID=A0AAN7UC56_9PEZI
MTGSISLYAKLRLAPHFSSSTASKWPHIPPNPFNLNVIIRRSAMARFVSSSTMFSIRAYACTMLGISVPRSIMFWKDIII